MLIRRLPWDDIAALLLIGAACVAVVAPQMAAGRVPFDLGAAAETFAWRGVVEPQTPAIGRTPRNDAQFQAYYPDAWHIHAAASGERSLLWDPYSDGGRPFLARWRSGALSPFALPLYLVPFRAALWTSVLLQLAAAGGCAYYALRRMGEAPALAAIAGLGFALGNGVLVWSSTPVSDGAVWLPLVVVYAERCALGQRGIWPRGALVLALIGLGGEPELAIASATLSLAYVLVRLRASRDWRLWTDALFSWSAAAIAAIGLLAIQWVPYAEWVLTRSDAAVAGADTAGFPVPFLAWPLVAMLVLARATLPYMHALVRARLLAAGTAAGVVTTVALLGSATAVVPLRIEHAIPVAEFAMLFAVVSTLGEWLMLGAQECKRGLRRSLLLAGMGLVCTVLWYATGGFGGSVLLPRPGCPLISWNATAVALVVAAIGLSLWMPKARLLGYAIGFAVAVALAEGTSMRTAYSPADQALPHSTPIASLRAIDTRLGLVRSDATVPLGVHGIRSSVFETDAGLANLPTRILLDGPAIESHFAEVRRDLRVDAVLATGSAVFRNPLGRPRAYLANGNSGKVVPAKALVDRDGTTVHVDLPGSHNGGMLVLAGTWAPGWRAEFADRSVACLRTKDGSRSVEAAAGTGSVTFVYRPASLYAGLWTTVLAAVLCAARAMLAMRRDRA